jgi:hypothetical protein
MFWGLYYIHFFARHMSARCIVIGVFCGCRLIVLPQSRPAVAGCALVCCTAERAKTGLGETSFKSFSQTPDIE